MATKSNLGRLGYFLPQLILLAEGIGVLNFKEIKTSYVPTARRMLLIIYA
jgi:hypothetical protein